MGIWSTGDRYTGEQQMQETAKYMAADFRYERVENSTHWTMLDQPEVMNQLIMDWLQKD
jgi:pimeloyl-ACP methyl ester carboxylesterase